ncbi:MAG: glycosyltransferase family 4 protein [Candidatus Omnitrophica bacterium]|nr:glycosyltransferase family 4 protein [Candidatus Omnitrophota bacterium]
MKICFITHAFPPEKLGGAEIYAQRISKALATRGHRIVVITQAPFTGISSLLPKVTFDDGIKLYRFYPVNIFSIYRAHTKPVLLKGLWRILDFVNPFPPRIIKRILKKEKPDIIHTHIIHGFSPFLLLSTIKKLGIPLVQTIHSYGFFCIKCDLLKFSGKPCHSLPPHCRLYSYIAQSALANIHKTVISPSQFCLEMHKNQGFFKQSRCIVLPNPVADENFGQQKNNPGPETKFVILYAGRLTMNKGVHILIDAFTQLQSDTAMLFIAGEGPWEKRLRQKADANPNIVFTGRLDFPSLVKLYAKAAVTVVPSLYYEPFGNVIIESLAAGTPVIASRIGGIPELIRHGYNGYLFEPGNSIQLKNYLKCLMDSPPILKELSEYASLSARQYRICDHLKELEKIYVTAI